jgi:alpha-N-arabinofuranosidase
MPYTNPIIPGFYPDPSICRVGQDYYLTTSSFSWFPGLPLFHSKDLVHWRQVGHILDRPGQLPLNNPQSYIWCGLWAPTLRFHAGKFYAVCTNVKNGGQFLVSTDDPEGPWSDPVWIDAPGWDNSIYFDENGACHYHMIANGGIQLAPLNLETGEPGEFTCIFQGSGEGGLEAPHIYRIGEWFYLVVAEGGTAFNHMVTIARSRELYGTYEIDPDSPLLTHRHVEMDNIIRTTGHGDLVEAHDGSWWMVHLGVRTFGFIMFGNHHLGRETFLTPIRWKDDGWPVANEGRDLQVQMDVPTLPLHPWPETPTRDEFDDPHLGFDWNFLRNPPEGCWSLTENPGELTLHGTAEGLGAHTLALVGRRLRDPYTFAATELRFDPDRENEEAGLCVFMDENHYSTILVRTTGSGGREVVVRRRIGVLIAEVAREDIGHGPVELRLTADPRWFRFGLKCGDLEVPELAAAETRYHSSEVAWGFTGCYLALYATGNGQPAQAPARFAWFDYRSDPTRQWVPHMPQPADFNPAEPRDVNRPW